MLKENKELPRRVSDTYRKWRAGIAQELYDLCIKYNIDTKTVSVKEKYWRFDITTWWPHEFMEEVYKLEEKSLETCCECWKRWCLREDFWWIMTYCNKHYIEHKKEQGLYAKLCNAIRVCSDCWLKYWHRPEWHLATFHKWQCNICLEKKQVTEPRDYWYFKEFLEKLREEK